MANTVQKLRRTCASCRFCCSFWCSARRRLARPRRYKALTAHDDAESAARAPEAWSMALPRFLVDTKKKRKKQPGRSGKTEVLWKIGRKRFWENQGKKGRDFHENLEKMQFTYEQIEKYLAGKLENRDGFTEFYSFTMVYLLAIQNCWSILWGGGKWEWFCKKNNLPWTKDWYDWAVYSTSHFGGDSQVSHFFTFPHVIEGYIPTTKSLPGGIKLTTLPWFDLPFLKINPRPSII